MTETITETEYKGAILTHVYKGPSISVTAAVDHSMKLEYEGPACLDYLTHSYKYGEQAQILTYQQNEPKAVFRQATSRDWYRVECHFPVAEFDELCLAWLKYRGLNP